MDPDFVLRLISITIVNIVLSGDNIIVIGMAAASLPPGQRRFAILGGGLLAVFLRIALTSAATRVMLVPLISAVGGFVLYVLAWGLVKIDSEPNGGSGRRAYGLRDAIQLIIIADITMSVDNVIAVGGAARGDDVLLVASILVSAPILMALGGYVATLIDRFRWLAYVGAGAICVTASRMILEDAAISPRMRLGAPLTIGISLAIGAGLPLGYRWIQLRRRRNVVPLDPKPVIE